MGSVDVRLTRRNGREAHHVRDVTQRADASRIRPANGPQVMAALRNHATNIAAAQRAAGWHPTAITDALNAA